MGLALATVTACTVEPLNSSVSSNALQAPTDSILASTKVSPVYTRVAQQVRNQLLFAMNGGKLQEGGRYRVDLTVTPSAYNLSVETNSLAPTSAQVAIFASYNLVDTTNGKSVARGSRKSIASYDRTPQSFANERAQRDAENRAAADMAQKLRLAISHDLTSL